MANMGMSIHAAAEGHFAVVEVKDFEFFQADGAFKIVQHGVGAAGRGDVVSGGQHVARIQAHAKTLRPRNAPENTGNMRKGITQTGTLARRGFHADGYAGAGVVLQDLIVSGNNFFQPDILALANMGARMRHQAGDAQVIAALHLMTERRNGLVAQRRIGGSQIDQVTIVRHDLRKAQARGMLPERGYRLGLQRLGVPLLLFLGEDLHCGAAEFLGFQQGQVHAACN